MSQHILDDSKDITAHVETTHDDAALKTADVYQLKSEFDTLTVRQVLWKFRKSISFAIFIGITALAEGYASMINGWVGLDHQRCKR